MKRNALLRMLCLLLVLCARPGSGSAQADMLRIPEYALDPGAVARALEPLGGIEVRMVPELSMDRQSLYAQLISGDAPVDILPLRSDAYDVQQMVRKGYLLDLSEEPLLLAFARDSLEAYEPLIFDGDGLYALPIGLEVVYLGANLAAFAAVEQPVPRSLPALLDLATWWAQDGHARYPEYSLFDSVGVKRQIRQLIHASYVDSLVGTGLPLHFDMAVYGRLMERLDALDVSAFEEDADKPRGISDAMPLLIPGWGYRGEEPTVGQAGIQMLALSVDGAQQARRLGVARLLAIPASSPRADTAKRFLNAYLAKSPEAKRAALSRSWQQPVINPHFDKERASQEGIVANLERIVAELPEGPDKRAHEDSLQRAQTELRDFERIHRYVLSSKDLAEHQERMAEVYLSDSLGIVMQQALWQEDSGFHMYAQGAITLDQFKQQANERIRLMTLEAQ